MRRMGANAAAGAAGTSTAADQTNRVRTRTPPHRSFVPADRAALVHPAAANSASSSSRARANASRRPRGRIGNALRAAASLATVAVRRPSTSSRPTRA